MKKTIVSLLALLGLPTIVTAGEVGHYSAGMWGPWDHLSPARGTGQMVTGLVYYKADKVMNGGGNKIDSGLFNVNLDLPELMAMVKYAPDINVLGATYAFALVPTYGRTNVNAYLSGTAFNGSAEKTGWADFYAIPINLTWKTSKYASVSAQYAFWAPTGSYDSHRTLNNGLGYWSHDFRLTGSFFPTGEPTTLLSISGLYELNTKKEGKDIHPGNRAILELGASHIFNEYLIAGLIGTANWEVSKTTGLHSTDDGRDRVFSAGPQATIYLIPNKLSITAQYLIEFGAKDRTQGQFLYALVGWQF